MRCPHCGEPMFWYDFDGGTWICSGCGYQMSAYSFVNWFFSIPIGLLGCVTLGGMLSSSLMA